MGKPGNRENDMNKEVKKELRWLESKLNDRAEKLFQGLEALGKRLTAMEEKQKTDLWRW